jgi:potassium-transporting ATPase ATP-binding subunit
MSEMNTSTLNASLVRGAIVDALRKLRLVAQLHNPVMFVTEVGAIPTSLWFAVCVAYNQFSGFELQISLWLWFTVLFANFAESLAEGRGKPRA